MVYRITRPGFPPELSKQTLPAVRTIGPAGGGASSAAASLTTMALNADQTFNSTTPAAITGLSFAVLSGVRYHFKFVLVFQSNTATCGLRIAATIPATTTMSGFGQIRSASAGVASTWAANITVSGGEIASDQVESINVDRTCLFEGVIVPSANGTFQLQAGLEVAGAVITIKKGSCGFITTF